MEDTSLFNWAFKLSLFEFTVKLNVRWICSWRLAWVLSVLRCWCLSLFQSTWKSLSDLLIEHLENKLESDLAGADAYERRDWPSTTGIALTYVDVGAGTGGYCTAKPYCSRRRASCSSFVGVLSKRMIGWVRQFMEGSEEPVGELWCVKSFSCWKRLRVFYPLRVAISCGRKSDTQGTKNGSTIIFSRITLRFFLNSNYHSLYLHTVHRV